MKASDIPGAGYKFIDSWADRASGGNITTPIPDTTGSTVRASLQLGFPPDTALSEGAGGTPPDYRDFQGIFNVITLWLQWMQAGGSLIPWDSTFGSNIYVNGSPSPGYPKGAIIQNPNLFGSYIVSNKNDNTDNPFTPGQTGWIFGSVLSFQGLDDASGADANHVVVNDMLAGTPGALDAYYGQVLNIKKAKGPNTGAVQMNLQGFGYKAVVNANGSALSSGQLPLGCWFTCVWDGSTNSNQFILTKGSA